MRFIRTATLFSNRTSLFIFGFLEVYSYMSSFCLTGSPSCSFTSSNTLAPGRRLPQEFTAGVEGGGATSCLPGFNKIHTTTKKIRTNRISKDFLLVKRFFIV